MRPLLALACALALALPSAAIAAPPVITDVNGVRVEARFVDPDSNNGYDPEPVLREFRRRIDGVPCWSGDWVGLSVYSFKSTHIYDGIKAKQACGVRFYILQSGDQNKPDTVYGQ